MPDIEGFERRWRVLAVVCAAQFLCILDVWVVNIAFSTLEAEFRPATVPDVSWILNVYTILLAALLVPAGRLADAVGRRTCFLAGLALFGLASLGCALAPALPVLIGFRALQGAGAAILIPTSLSLALPTFPPRERTTAVGVWAAVASVAAASGPVLGGVLVALSWRWIFLINVPIIAATLLAGARVLPRPPASGTRRRLDAGGALLVLGAVGAICTGLVQAGTWPAPLTWSLIGAGGGLGAWFCIRAARHPDPVIPARLFATRVFRVGAAGLTAYFVGFAAMLLAITLLLTERWHVSALDAALYIAPGPITSGVLSPFAGRVVARVGIRGSVVAGAALFAATAAWPLLTAGDVPSYPAVILPSVLLWGMANALIQPALFGAAGAVPSADMASGTAVLTMARQLGSALGVALLVALLGAGAASGLAGYRYVWIMVIVTAVLTGAAGLYAGRRE